jgi:hypothetical protein
MEDWQVGLWLAVIASGIYHGINPGMGWPLALSAGLMKKKQSALFGALGPLAIGHLAAIFLIILPFSMLAVLVVWRREIQIGAALILITFGVFRFFNRRHPLLLARIAPTRLALWSFVIAIAHGAGLMLVPMYLGLHQTDEMASGHMAASTLMANSVVMALFVSLVHVTAMITTGGLTAFLVYHWLGLTFVSRSWFNLDGFWALSLIAIGLLALVLTW